MLEQDGPVLADDVEDVAPVVGQQWMVHRAVRRVLELREVEPGDLEEVAQLHHPLDLEDVLLLVEAELRGQHAAMDRVRPLPDLQSNDGGEVTLPQLRLDQLQEIVGRLRVLLHDRVAGDPEELRGVDLHPREEHVQVGHHQVFQGDEGVAPIHRDEALGHVPADRYLDAGHVDLAPAREAQGHQQVERQVGDEGEGVGRIHGQGGQHGEDVAPEMLPQPFPGVGGQVGDLGDPDVMPRQQAHQLVVDPVLAPVHLPHHGMAELELLGWGATVQARRVHPGGDLLLEPPDALHEELVQVVADDGQELDPLEQGGAGVVRLVQHALVEGQPGQLPVEVETGIVEVDLLRGGRCLFHRAFELQIIVGAGLGEAFGHEGLPVVNRRGV